MAESRAARVQSLLVARPLTTPAPLGAGQWAPTAGYYQEGTTSSRALVACRVYRYCTSTRTILTRKS